MLQLQDTKTETGMIGQVLKVGWLSVKRLKEEATKQFVVITDHWVAGYTFIPVAN
jgi:hypothetical protein